METNKKQLANIRDWQEIIGIYKRVINVTDMLDYNTPLEC